MDCAQVEQEELLERYVSGQLSETDREAVEEHYFGCEHCHEQLRTLRAMAEELQALPSSELETTTRSRFRGVAWLLAVTAGAVVAVSLWPRPPGSVGTPASTTQRPPEQRADLQELAQIEPPEYRPVILRGAADAPEQRFRAAMKSYQYRNYAAAVSGLRAAQKLAPDRADIHFYLGVSELLGGGTEAAVFELQRTIVLGDTPFLEDAHFYLAKAYLRRADTKLAIVELKQVVELRGEHADQAGQLQQRLAALGIR